MFVDKSGGGGGGGSGQYLLYCCGVELCCHGWSCVAMGKLVLSWVGTDGLCVLLRVCQKLWHQVPAAISLNGRQRWLVPGVSTPHPCLRICAP